MFHKLNNDIIFCILNLCDIESICILSVAISDVKNVAILCRNALFKKLYLGLLSPGQAFLYKQQHGNSVLPFFDMYFQKLFESISNGTLSRREFDKVLFYSSTLDKDKALMEYVDNVNLLENWYANIINKRPVWAGCAKKDIFKIVTKLLVYGCSHTPLILIGAILAGDKKCAKFILNKDNDILTRNINTPEFDQMPFAFYLQKQVAHLKKSNKLSKRQESYIHSFVNIMISKIPYDKKIWNDGGGYWTIKAYYLHLLSD
jgi:hypothetical protein